VLSPVLLIKGEENLLARISHAIMSVPRFTDEMLVPIKRVMLVRQPTFLLTPADVEDLVRETGLLKTQIQDWARNFRERLGPKSLDDLLAYLSGVGKVT
jgi:hypothetical protein